MWSRVQAWLPGAGHEPKEPCRTWTLGTVQDCITDTHRTSRVCFTSSIYKHHPTRVGSWKAQLMMIRIFLCVASSNGKGQMWWKCISKEGLQNGMDIVNFLHCGGNWFQNLVGWKLEHELSFKFQPLSPFILSMLATQESVWYCKGWVGGCSLCGVCKQTSFQTKKTNCVVEMNIIIIIHFVVSVEMCGWEGVWCVVCWRGTIEVSDQFRTN